MSTILNGRTGQLTRVVDLDDGAAARGDVRQLGIRVSDRTIDPNSVTVGQVVVVAAVECRASDKHMRAPSGSIRTSKSSH